VAEGDHPGCTTAPAKRGAWRNVGSFFMAFANSNPRTPNVSPHGIEQIKRLQGVVVCCERLRSLGQRDADPTEVGRALGRYVVGGSVGRSGKRLTVSCELCEAEGGRAIWAERDLARPLGQHAEKVEWREPIVTGT
jgi:hypothetical protein